MTTIVNRIGERGNVSLGWLIFLTVSLTSIFFAGVAYLTGRFFILERSLEAIQHRVNSGYDQFAVNWRRVQGEAINLSLNETVAEALRDFEIAYRRLETDVLDSLKEKGIAEGTKEFETGLERFAQTSPDSPSPMEPKHALLQLKYRFAASLKTEAPVLAAALESVSYEEVHDRFSPYLIGICRNTGYDNLHLVDLAGTLLFSVNPGPALGLPVDNDRELRRIYAKAVEALRQSDGQPQTLLVASAGDDEPPQTDDGWSRIERILIAIPVEDQPTGTQGFVLLERSIDELMPQIDAPYRLILLQGDGDPSRLGRSIPAQGLQHEQPNGVPVFRRVHRVDELGLSSLVLIIGELPARAALTGATDLGRALLILGLAGVGAGLLFASVVSRQASRRLGLLDEALKKAAAGDQDLRLPEKTSGRMGNIYRSANTLLDRAGPVHGVSPEPESESREEVGPPPATNSLKTAREQVTQLLGILSEVERGVKTGVDEQMSSSGESAGPEESQAGKMKPAALISALRKRTRDIDEHTSAIIEEMIQLRSKVQVGVRKAQRVSSYYGRSRECVSQLGEMAAEVEVIAFNAEISRGRREQSNSLSEDLRERFDSARAKLGELRELLDNASKESEEAVLQNQNELDHLEKVLARLSETEEKIQTCLLGLERLDTSLNSAAGEPAEDSWRAQLSGLHGQIGQARELAASLSESLRQPA